MRPLIPLATRLAELLRGRGACIRVLEACDTGLGITDALRGEEGILGMTVGLARGLGATLGTETLGEAAFSTTC